MKLAASILLLAAIATAWAQTPQFTDPANLRGERVKPRDGRELPIDTGASGLAQLLRKLNTRASILNIVAHPDDEDGGMLTLYARGLGARVTDLSLTRGEGGQNAMTGDFEDALGLLRTQELLANDRYTGVDQLFGTEVDFGFSKTKEEAFAKWTHDRVLYDAVRAIRLVRPLVITATFIGGVTDGHGQHQVSGQIAQEAFKAAADPNVFPDQIAEGILPWQALRVYARVPFADINAKGVFDYATGQYVAPHFVNYVTGKLFTTKPPTDVIVPEGTPDPLFTAAAANPSDMPPGAPTTPLSYAQFSRIGLGLQRTQISKNMRLPTSGDYDSGYTLYGSVLCNDSATTHSPSTSPQNCHPEQAQRAEGPASGTTPNLSSRPKSAHFADAVERPAVPPAAASPLATFSIESRPNFFTGIDTSIEGIATLATSAKGNIAIVIRSNLAGIEHSIAEASIDFKPNHPELAANRLSEALKLTDMTIDNISRFANQQLPLQEKANILHELRIKRVQLNDAISLALGLSLDATASTANLVAKSTLAVHTAITTDSNERIPYFDQELEAPYEEPSRRGVNTLKRGPYSDGYPTVNKLRPWTENIDANPSLTAHETRPYFFRTSIEEPVYQLRSSYLRSASATPAALVAWANLSYQGVDVRLGRIVHAGTQAISVVPGAQIAFRYPVQVLPQEVQRTQIQLFTVPDMEKPMIAFEYPKGWTVTPPFDIDGDSHLHLYDLQIPPNQNSNAIIRARLKLVDGTIVSEDYRSVGYGDLPRTNYYTPATTRIVPVDLQLPTRHNIAYLPGTGDAVPEALASINLAPTILTVADLTPTTLAKYDTVILGVRTYNAHPDLHGAPTKALLDYARNGGNVVVQYQTPEFTAADAPYPLSLGSNEKVVDETAPVVLLSPGTNSYPEPSTSALASPGTNRYPEASASGLIADKKEGALAPGYALLTTPNRITPADFNNWIEERGHGFLSTWDPHYTALTETHDPGGPETAPQLPQRGGLITTTLGKGRWTYVAFALYRQLPEAVPGAYRLFLNLLNP